MSPALADKFFFNHSATREAQCEIFLVGKLEFFFFFVYIAWQNTDKKIESSILSVVLTLNKPRYRILHLRYWHFCKNSECQKLCYCSVTQSRPTRWTAASCRLPCPSPSPGVCTDSRPSSQWCHPTISSSVKSFISSVIHQQWLQFAPSVQKTLSGTELPGSWVLAQGGSYILPGCYFFPLKLLVPVSIPRAMAGLLWSCLPTPAHLRWLPSLFQTSSWEPQCVFWNKLYGFSDKVLRILSYKVLQVS